MLKHPGVLQVQTGTQIQHPVLPKFTQEPPNTSLFPPCNPKDAFPGPSANPAAGAGLAGHPLQQSPEPAEPGLR